MKITKEEICIISGEGQYGTAEIYAGKHTEQAIKTRLTKERCNGDRWARAVQYSHISKDGAMVGIDLETNLLCVYPKLD